MADEAAPLLSTLLSLPDEERTSVERALVPLARSAALGELAADVAHDVANPLFGVLGLVDLLLEDATPGSEDEDRLRLLRQTALEMKGTLRALLDFARPAGEEEARADLAASTREAVALVRHGIGRALELDERYPTEPELVACSPGELVQAALHLLVAARGTGDRVSVAVEACTLHVAPAGDDSIGLVAARAIAAAHGGSLERSGGGIVLSLPALVTFERSR